MSSELALVIGYIVLCVTVVMLALIINNDTKKRKELQKKGILVTKRGTYTFTPHEVKQK